MDKTTKQLIVMTLVGIIFLFGSIVFIANEVNKKGGVKQIIINAGKEIKDISREIEKE